MNEDQKNAMHEAFYAHTGNTKELPDYDSDEWNNFVAGYEAGIAVSTMPQGEREDDQRRITACLRAFEGVDTEDIEEGPRMLDVLTAKQREINQLRATAQVQPVAVDYDIQTLRNALEEIVNWPDGSNRYGQDNIKRFAKAVLAAVPSPQQADGGGA